MKRKLRSDLVREYIRKFPGSSKSALSRLIYSKHPDLFINEENVRTSIRYLTGSKGEKSREGNKQIETMEKKIIPDSYAEVPEPFIMPIGNNKVAIASDMHIPYHDIDAIQLFVKYVQNSDCNTLLLNGDILDFYRISRFQKDPRKVNMKTEVERGREFFQWLKQELPDIKIYYKLGNHEFRLEAYMMNKASELLELDLYSVEDIYGLPQLGITVIPHWQWTELGKLTVYHGHELRIIGGVNPARTLYLKTKISALMSHVHRTSMHSEPNAKKKNISCWTIGCMCSVWPEYGMLLPHNQGFATVRFDKDGYFEVDNFQIIEGKITRG